jgi:hypothetical protein
MRSRSLPAAAVTFALLLFAAALTIAPLSRSVRAQASTQNGAAQAVPANAQTISIDDIHEGMKGVAYTIFSGDTVEPMDLDVIGVLHNALGPKQDIILVQLHGEKVEHTGVVAGMSGSPVYLNGKLAGALSMKLGIFSKEAIGGVTPIANMLEVAKVAAQPAPNDAAALPPPSSTATTAAATTTSDSANAGADAPVDLNQLFAAALPQSFTNTSTAAASTRAALDAQKFLIPIETPLIFTGVSPQILEPFMKTFSSLGLAAPLTATIGGTSPASPDDSALKPGDMIGMQLVGGDLSLNAGCTVTTLSDGRLLACGHPLFSFGDVAIPITRARVVTTLASAMESTKIISTSGIIGTLTEDRTTAVAGRLGSGPNMIPVNVSISTPQEEKQFHFRVAESRQLTPVLVALATANGVSGNTAYSEGTTLQLSGEIDLQDHPPVKLENLFAPTEGGGGGTQVAFDVLSTFMRVFENPYEHPHVERVDLQVKSIPEHRSAVIEGAWSDKNEVHPGETVDVKVMLRPYRGAPFTQQIPIVIPPQAVRGPLELVICDSDTLNRLTQGYAGPSQLTGLDQLIALLNRERRNDRLYAALLQPTPTLLVEDKQLPNVPLSEINIMNQRRNPGGSTLLWHSLAGEWSTPMNQVIVGQRMQVITVK